MPPSFWKQEPQTTLPTWSECIKEALFGEFVSGWVELVVSSMGTLAIVLTPL